MGQLETTIAITDAKPYPTCSPPVCITPSINRRNGLGTVLAVQAWGDVIFGIFIAIALVLVTLLATPHKRDKFINDMTIAYTDALGREMPFWLSILIPCLLLLVTSMLVELIINRRNRSSTMQGAFFLHFVLQGVVACVTAMLICEILKNMCGVARPQYLARCKPADTAFPPNLKTALTSIVTCTEPDSAQLRDGTKSFPSGQSTSTAVASAFVICHIMGGVYGRQRPMLAPGASRVHNFFKDMGHSVLLLWMALVFFVPWYTAATNVVDYLHSTADVTAGLLLGFTTGGALGARAVARSRVIVEALTN